MKYFIGFVVLVVVIVIVAGLLVIGSPATERARRFDLQRINDLKNIETAVVDYWQAKEVLPEDLVDTEDALRGIKIPFDPETKQAYEYNVLGSAKFELCAVFNFGSEQVGSFMEREVFYPGDRPIKGNVSWRYSQGRSCFEREIDPDFFTINQDAIQPKVAR